MPFTITKLRINAGVAKLAVLSNGTDIITVHDLDSAHKYIIRGEPMGQTKIDNAEAELTSIGDLITYASATTFKTMFDNQDGLDIQTYNY